MARQEAQEDGWFEAIAPLAGQVDLEATARTSGALTRRREIRSAESLLRLVMAWGPGGLSLRQSATWADTSGIAAMGDAAVLRRLRRSADWLEGLVQAVLEARSQAARPASVDGRLLRLMDGTTFGVVGSNKPGWRLHAGFDLALGRFDGIKLTSTAQGEGLEQIPVTQGEIRIADRGFARPDGLRHMIDHGGDFLIRLGSRSLKLEQDKGVPIDWLALFATALKQGAWDGSVDVLHGRKGRKKWPPLPIRLMIRPLPPEQAEAARQRLRRAGQRESYKPSPLAIEAAGYVMLITSLHDIQADDLFDLYRLRWQIELAFKRLKSLVGARCVPTKDPDLARTWLYAHLLTALIAEDFSADFGESFP